MKWDGVYGLKSWFEGVVFSVVFVFLAFFVFLLFRYMFFYDFND